MKTKDKTVRNGRQAIFLIVCLALALVLVAKTSGCRDGQKKQEQVKSPRPADSLPQQPMPPIPLEWIKGDVIQGRWNTTLKLWEFTGRNGVPLGTARWNPDLKKLEYKKYEESAEDKKD